MRHTSRKTIVNAKQCTLLNQHIKPTHCRRYRGVNATPRIGTIKQHVLAVALTIVCALCFSSISAAATNGPQQTRTYHLDLPEQTVATALNSLSEQTDIQVLFPYDIAAQLRSEPLLGRFSIELALERLLRDTGLHGGLTSSGVITISQTGSESTTNQNGKGKRMNIKNSTKRKTLLAGLVGLFAAGGTAQVAAQGGEAATSQSAIDEIIVTATRRAESLNDTALSIAAIGGEEISRRNLTEMNDYLRTLPGVSFMDQGEGRSAVVIRGLSVDPELEAFASAVTPVGIYFGEVPLGGLTVWGGSTDIKMIDLERVEVLRGPQGTLFGSSSLAGAVRYIPKSPDLQQVGGSIKTGYSNTSEFGGDNTAFEGVINIPLISDELAVRALVYHHQSSGYIKNIAGTQLSTSGALTPSITTSDAVATFGGAELYQDKNDVGNTSHTGGRLAVLWKPSDALSMTLQYTKQEVEQEGLPYVQLNTGGYTQVSQSIGNNVPELAGKEEGLKDDIEITNLIVEYDFGWATLLSSSAWVEDESEQVMEQSSFVGGSPVVNLISGSADVFVQELRLVSELDGPLQYVAGVYYEDVDYVSLAPLYATGDLSINALGTPFGSTNPLVNEQLQGRSLEQLAFYGEISYNLTENLTLTGGVRRYDYERNAITFLEGVLGSVDENTTTDDQGTNIKVNLSYSPREDTLIYAQVAEGFRPGNANPPPPKNLCDVNDDGILDGTNAPIRNGFDADTTKNFELGTKLSLLDNRLQVNAALYRVDWEGIPLNVAPGKLPSQPEKICFSNTIVNAGEARAEGLEIETIYQVSEGLRVTLGGAYTNVELTEDALSLNALDGDRLPSSPDYSVNLGLQYEFEVKGGYPSYIRSDYAYVSEFFPLLGEVGEKGGGYGQLNMSAGVSLNDINLELFVNNLTDEDAITSVGILIPDSRAYRLKPRTIGLSVGYDF